jgi:hypothetical protein
MLALALVGLVTMFPAIAAVVPGQLVGLYGIAPPTDPTAILLRHRQVLLGLLGAALLYAAADPRLRSPVIAAALVSKLAFIGLALGAPVSTGEITRVALVDVVAVLLLVVAAVGSRRYAREAVASTTVH